MSVKKLLTTCIKQMVLKSHSIRHDMIAMCLKTLSIFDYITSSWSLDIIAMLLGEQMRS